MARIVPITLISFAFGLVVYCFTCNVFIIFRAPHAKYVPFNDQKRILKKRLTLSFCKNNAWQREEIELLWSDNKAENLFVLINALLELIKEEKRISKKTTVQSVALTPNNEEALISFDRRPFRKNGSTHEKLHLVEAILKTIRENDVPLKTIQFLVDHKAMQDYHLDFSRPWPIEGFLQTNAHQ